MRIKQTNSKYLGLRNISRRGGVLRIIIYMYAWLRHALCTLHFKTGPVCHALGVGVYARQRGVECIGKMIIH